MKIRPPGLRFCLSLAIGIILFCPIGARAQTGFTQVTATVVDPQGFPYSGGTVSVDLVPDATNPTVNGQPFSGHLGPAQLDLNGVFNLTLADNTLVNPSGTKWHFHICGNLATVQWPIGTGSQCFDYTATISGVTLNISSALAAVAPSLTNVCANSNLPSAAACTGGGGAITGSVSPKFVPYSDETNDLQDSGWSYSLDTAQSLSCSSGLTATCRIDIGGGSLAFYESELGSTSLCFNEGSGGSPICVQGNNDFSLGLGPDAKVDLSGNLTVVSCTGCGGGSPGSPSGSPQANGSGSLVGVPFSLFPHLAATETGTGIEASPWANPTDNAAGIQTQFTALATRGGDVDMPSGRFNVANGTTIQWTSAGIDIRGGSWSIGNGGNGSVAPNYATTIRMGGASAPLFNVEGPTYPTPVITGVADDFSIWGAGRTVTSTNNSCFVFGNGVGGFLIHHVGMLNCGYDIDMGPDSSDGGLNLTEGLYVLESNFNQSGYGLYFDPSKWMTHSAFIDNFFGEDDQQPIYSPATTNANGPDYGNIFLANIFSHSCRMSSCATDPSHIMWGNNESILMANFSNDPGNCPSYDPNCGSGSINPSDGMILRGSNNVVSGNFLEGSTGSKVGIHVYGSGNRILGNGFLNNAGGDVTLESGANDNIVDEPAAIESDSGARNVFQEVGFNAGDPNSTGNWNGHNKWPGLHIRDTTNNVTYLYTEAALRQLLPDGSNCTSVNGIVYSPSLGNFSCSTNVTYNPSNTSTTAQLQVIANGANNTAVSITGSGTSGVAQLSVATTTAGGLAEYGIENQAGQFAAFLFGDSTSSAPFNGFTMTGPSSGTALPINIVQRQNAPINFYCNSTSVTCLVGAASGNWEFKNQLTVDSFASASSTPVCSNSGTLASCSGISSVLTGTTGSIGGSALLAGQCSAGTATVTGATTSMVATTSPSNDPDSSLSTGVGIYAFVSGSNTVTVRVCAIVAVTPAATTYNVRVLQ